MNIKFFVATASIVFLLTSGQSWAQEENGGDESEATIRLMQRADAELPDAVMREIPLPAADNIPEQAEDGLATAASKRDKGLSNAEEALERNAEMIQNALDNVENRGRNENMPDTPAGPPDDLPQPPN